MLDLLQGWLVVMAALIGVVGPTLWWATRNDPPGVPNPYNDDTTRVIPLIPYDTTATVVLHEPLLIDARPVEDPDLVTDLLGEWRPGDHTPVEPILLGHVIHSHDWGTGTYELVRS